MSLQVPHFSCCLHCCDHYFCFFFSPIFSMVSREISLQNIHTEDLILERGKNRKTKNKYMIFFIIMWLLLSSFFLLVAASRLTCKYFDSAACLDSCFCCLCHSPWLWKHFMHSYKMNLSTSKLLMQAFMSR